MFVLTYESNNGEISHLFGGIFDTQFEAAKSVLMHEKGWISTSMVYQKVEYIYKDFLNVLGKVPKSGQYCQVYDGDVRTGIYYIWEF